MQTAVECSQKREGGREREGVFRWVGVGLSKGKTIELNTIAAFIRILRGLVYINYHSDLLVYLEHLSSTLLTATVAT